MSEQVRAMELFRKRLSSCRKLFDASRKSLANDDLPGLQATLDKINNQLVWIRQAQSNLESEFIGRHSETLHADLTAAMHEVEDVIFSSLTKRKFTKTTGHPKATLYADAVKLVREALVSRGCRCTTAELLTRNSQGVEFFTTLLMTSGMKSDHNIALPFYAFAVSERTTQPEKTYLTHLASLTTVFDPLYEWSSVSDLSFTVKRIIAEHFASSTVSITDALKHVLRCKLVAPSALQVELVAGLAIRQQEIIDAVCNYVNTVAHDKALGEVICKQVSNGSAKFVLKCDSSIGFSRMPELLKTLGSEM